MNVCIIGTGYVGLVTGASLAFLGNEVTCVDIDEAKIEKLRAGVSPIYEPGLDELLETCIERKKIAFTTDLEEGVKNAEVIYIAVGTPPSADGSPDLSYVKEAACGIGRSIFANQKSGLFRIIINKSTVPVGSGNWVEMLMREQIRKIVRSNANGNANNLNYLRDSVENVAKTFAVVSNPEFLREGTAISDTFYPARIVVGASNARAFDVLRELYEPLLEQNFTPPDSIAPRPETLKKVPFVTTDLTSAEMIKYAANSFLAMKISFANEIANICEQAGADVKRVVEGIGLDERIGSSFLNAGIGWGGSCFGKDVSALIEIAREYNYEPELLEAARAVNTRQRQIVIQKLQTALRIIKGKTIGLLGLAFKPDTDDVRDAPSYDIAAALIKMGANVKVFDPVAMNAFQIFHPTLDVAYASTSRDLATDCDAVVVVTEWEEFRGLKLKEIYDLMNGDVLIDGRNVFEPEEAHEIGFRYGGIGREKTLKSSKAPRVYDSIF